MARELKDITAEALDLPLTARAELASQLLDSLEDISEEESDALWAEEAERRYVAYKAGEIEAIPAEQVFARLRSRERGGEFVSSNLRTSNWKKQSPISTGRLWGWVLAFSMRSRTPLPSLSIIPRSERR